MNLNIKEIRRRAVVEIKEKIKKNPKYLHPCNKERLDDMKKLMFVSGNEFTQWMQNNGIMNNSTDIERKYKDEHARRHGFKDNNERIRRWRYNTGRQLPMEFNEDCAAWFGEFTENLMIHRYPGAKKMPYGNHGFDYLWIDEKGREVKIDNKGRCLRRTLYTHWSYTIRYNNIADLFILSGWNNRKSLDPMYAWEFKKNDLIRKGNGSYTQKVEFWNRDTFTIMNTLKGLEQFKDHQISIDWLKDAK